MYKGCVYNLESVIFIGRSRYYELDDSPGLGIEVNEAWLEEAAAEGYNFGGHKAQSEAGSAADDVKRGNFLRRRDGSYTNS